MIDLNALRNQLGSPKPELLTIIWHHYLKTGHWMPARQLHTTAGGNGGKKVIRPILEQLGGSIVYEQEENGVLHYALTLTGVLLSSDGAYLEEMLRGYLQIARDLAFQQPSRTHVSSEEILRHLSLTPDKVMELGRLLFISSFISGGSFGQNEWNAGLPRNIEDIPDDPRVLIHEIVLSNYDPNVPLSSHDRTVYYLSSKAKVRNEIFIFVENKYLRETAARDWAEAKLCFNAKAWKFCVMACGSVLEAMLLDSLLRDPEKAIAALKAQRPNRKPPNDLYQWNLIDLVDAAAGTDIISEASSHLGHALRLHRNLVHPGRQINEPIIVSEEESLISLNTVEKIIRDLSMNQQQKKSS